MDQPAPRRGFWIAKFQKEGELYRCNTIPWENLSQLTGIPVAALKTARSLGAFCKGGEGTRHEFFARADRDRRHSKILYFDVPNGRLEARLTAVRQEPGKVKAVIENYLYPLEKAAA